MCTCYIYIYIYIRITHRNRMEAKVLIFLPTPNPILLFSMPRNDRTAQSFILMIPGSEVLTFPVYEPSNLQFLLANGNIYCLRPLPLIAVAATFVRYGTMKTIGTSAVGEKV